MFAQHLTRWRNGIAALLLVLCCVVYAPTATAQTLLPIAWDGRFYASPATRGLAPAAQLNGPWQQPESDSAHIPVPFCVAGATRLALTTQVICPSDSTRDTLYLACEGVAGSSTVYWDGRLLHHQPAGHSSWHIPIPPALLQGRRHRLLVQLWQPAAPDSLGMPALLGLHKPVFLLRPTQADSLTAPLVSVRRKADSSLCYIPYTPAYGWHVPEQLFRQQLAQLQQAGVRGLYFTHPPGSRLLAIMASSGMQWQPKRPGCTYIGYGATASSWLAADGQRTAAYGTWQCATVLAQQPQHAQPVSRYWVLGVGLLVSLCLVAWKLSDAQNFALHFAGLSGRGKVRELISTNRLYRPIGLLVLTLLRYVMLASLLTLLLHYWQQQGRLLTLPIRSGSWLDIVLHEQQRVMPLWWWVLRMLMGYHLIKFILLEIVQRTYRRRYLAEHAFALELYGSYPLLPYSLLLALLLGVVPQGREALFYIAALLWVWYVWRRQWVLVRGLSSAQRMPGLAIVLYICTLEILPWLWVLY